MPILNYEKILKKKNLLTDEINSKIKKKLKIEINNAFNFAKKSKFPKKELLKKFIYAY